MPLGSSSSACGATDSLDLAQKHCLYDSFITLEHDVFKRYLCYVNENKHAERPARGIYISSIQDINLFDFVAVRKLYCKVQKQSDWKECTKCLPLIQLANKVSEHGICQVSTLFQRLFPNIKYQSDKAIRKLMQLPVAIFQLELEDPGLQKLFVTERYSGINYLSFSKVVQQFLLL